MLGMLKLQKSSLRGAERRSNPVCLRGSGLLRLARNDGMAGAGAHARQNGLSISLEIADVERVMKKRKAGTLKSGGSGKKVTSRKQAIAIGLSEARAEGKKVPKKAGKKTAKKATKKKKAKKK